MNKSIFARKKIIGDINSPEASPVQGMKRKITSSKSANSEESDTCVGRRNDSWLCLAI